MNLSAPFILRPVMTTLLTIAIIAFGVACYNSIAVSNLPDVNYPIITVTVPFPGTNPEIMANTVATPLEKQFMNIPGLKTVTSSNTLGSSTIILEFEIDRNIDLVAVDVESAISAAIPQLPPNLPSQPTFRKVNPSSTPVVYIAATSPTMTLGQIYDYANTFIGQRISIIDGVSQVVVYGSPFAVRAQMDPRHLASLGITLQEVSNAIAEGNQYQPLGQLDGDSTAFTIYDNGGLFKAEDYTNLIVAYRNGAPVRVGDLGEVVDSLQMDRSFRRYIDKQIDQPSVTIAVQREPGANAVKLSEAIHELLPKLQKQLPGSLELFTIFDRSDSIKESVREVEFTLTVALILVVLVIFIYLGNARDTIIPSIVMPLSIIATFAVIYPIGYTMDNLSLLALTLAIGFIIDDAIVVLENIVRKIEEGNPPLKAALLGTEQISFTILSMTLSLIAVFIPLIFMAGLIGKLFQEFAVTLAVVTLISGIISLTLTPMLCSRFLASNGKDREGKMAENARRLNEWMRNHYERALKHVLDHRPMMLIIGVLSVVLSLVFFKILPSDFIPDEDIGFIIAYTEAEQGTSSDQMHEYQNQVINALRDDPSIATIFSNSATPEYRQGILFLRLVERSKRKSINELIPLFNNKLKGIPGVNVYLKNVPLIDLNIGPQVRGSYQYLIQSLDTNELYSSAEALIKKMRSDPIFQGVSSDLEIKTPQVNLDIQRDLASSLGINVANFEQALLLGYSGNRVSRIQTPINQYDVIVELKRDLQRSIGSLDYLYLPSLTTSQTATAQQSVSGAQSASSNQSVLLAQPVSNTQLFVSNQVNGSSTSNPLLPVYNNVPSIGSQTVNFIGTTNLVPLNAVANWNLGVGPASINHFAQFPAVTITFNLARGVALSTGLDHLQKLADETLSKQVTGDMKGAAQTFRESISSMGFLLIITIFVIYIVLGILYESFIHPITILSTLPPAIVGALITLWIAGLPLSLYSYLGIILLIGIVKKNGILMVDFALDNIRQKGESAERSIYEAALQRFRPIMMTTIAAIMGALPIALGIGAGAESRRPLGLVIIGGMVVSQLITLFLTPVIYLYLEQVSERFAAWRARKSAR